MHRIGYARSFVTVAMYPGISAEHMLKHGNRSLQSLPVCHCTLLLFGWIIHRCSVPTQLGDGSYACPDAGCDYTSEEVHTADKTFRAIETFCIAYFTFELVLRFIVSPQKVIFVRDALNIIDFLAIVPFYIGLAAGDDDASSFSVLRIIK